MFTTGDVTLLNLASGKPNLIFAMDESRLNVMNMLLDSFSLKISQNPYTWLFELKRRSTTAFGFKLYYTEAVLRQIFVFG